MPNLGPHQALGEVLAAEALHILEPGARIIVLARDNEPFRVPACEAQLNAFLASLKRAGKSVASLQRYNLDPLRVVRVPPNDYYELLRKGRETDVVVSFLAVPELNPEQMSKLGGKRCRVLAVCTGSTPQYVDLKNAFEQKLLSTAVVSRNDISVSSLKNGKQGSFDQMFALATPGNVTVLYHSTNPEIKRTN